MGARHLARTQVPDNVLEPVVAAAIQGEVPAWRRFNEILYPRLGAIAGRFRLTRSFSALADREDDHHEVVVAVMARLHDQRFARLKLLHQVLLLGNDGGWPWITTVAVRMAIECARRNPEHLRSRVPRGEKGYIALVPLPDGVEERLPESARCVYTAEAREIIALAEAFLSRQQLRALRLWLVGWDLADIARKVRLKSPHSADLMVRSALAALRRQHRQGDP